MDYGGKKRIRVRCANCSMIYDIVVGKGMWGGDPENPCGDCPKCHSNAYDEVSPKKGSVLKYI